MLPTILLIALALLVVGGVPTRPLSKKWGKFSKQWHGTDSLAHNRAPVRGPYLIGVRTSQNSQANVIANLLPDAAAWEWLEYGPELSATNTQVPADIIH